MNGIRNVTQVDTNRTANILGLQNLIIIAELSNKITKRPFFSFLTIFINII